MKINDAFRYNPTTANYIFFWYPYNTLKNIFFNIYSM